MAAWFVLLFTWVGCATDASPAQPEDAPDAGADAAAPADCVLPSTCQPFDLGLLAGDPCCTPTTSCGYLLPPLDEETLMFFPQAEDFYAQVTEGDPNGMCAPENFFFGPRPGLYEHRVEVEDGQDILITPECESFTLGAFILPGCCLPDNSCGLSTDESWPTLGTLAGDTEAPFAQPQCTSAEVLNQQLRDSVVLEDAARTTASGSCDHAALVERNPDA